MSVAILGSLIIWLIVAVIVIAIVVYFVNWLYRRSSKEVSFVRTGLFGEKVVINSGAFVLPFIHEVTPVNMNVLRMQVVRNRDDALITKDRMRVDIESEFYVRVPPTREAVTIAAATLGRRTMNVAELDALLSGKLVSALRAVASEMTMEEMHERRGEYVTRVKESALEGLKRNGLELESVAITDLDQTDLEFFNPSNRFDAEGLTQSRSREAGAGYRPRKRDRAPQSGTRHRSAACGTARRTRPRAVAARHRGRAGADRRPRGS
jgi:uncharacterized membrane protein YqiK